MSTKCRQNVDNMWTVCGHNVEYVENMHLYEQKQRTQTQWGGRRRRRLCFWLFYIINIYGYSLYIPYIFHIYFLDMFHVFSTFCPHFAPCSTFCPHVVSIFSTFWKLREVYMLKNTPHDSLFNKYDEEGSTLLFQDTFCEL